MDIHKTAEGIVSSWPRPLGLASALALVLMSTWPLSQKMGLRSTAVAAVLLSIAVIAIWLYQRRYPRCPKGKFGFVIAISVDDPSTYKMFQRDFVEHIARQLRAGAMGEHVWVSELQQFRLARALDDDEARLVRERSRASFVLFGQLRTRDEDTKRHYLDLRGLVGHAETQDSNKSKLVGEFTELLPSRVIAESKNALPVFEMTSTLSSIVAKYISGIAAFLSGFKEAAETLYNDAADLAKRQTGVPVAEKILERLPTRLSEISISNGRHHYERWKETRDDADLHNMRAALSKAPSAASSFPEWRTLNAISSVALGASADEIEAHLGRLPSNEPVAQMNAAFLSAWRGDLKSAARHYRNADQLNVSLETIEEVIEFLLWFRDFRPEAYVPMSFALGFISLVLLKDKRLAVSYFADFQARRGSAYDHESTLITKWFADIEKPAATPA